MTSAASTSSAAFCDYNQLWWEVERPQRQVVGTGWRPPASMILSFLGFPCYLLAVALAFWRPVATLIICGGLWVLWTIKAPMPTADERLTPDAQ